MEVSSIEVVDIKQYISLVNFLGSVLGSNSEIIFYTVDLDSKSLSVEATAGKKIDKSIIDIDLAVFKTKLYIQHDYIIDYGTSSKKKLNVIKSIFFIKNNHNHLEGILCVNIDYFEYEKICNNLLQLASPYLSINNFKNNNLHNSSSNEIYELSKTVDDVDIFPTSIENLIFELIGPDISKKYSSLNQKEKINIIERLEEKGVFQMKGAVFQVAKVLFISEPSIYRYLKIIKSKNYK